MSRTLLVLTPMQQSAAQLDRYFANLAGLEQDPTDISLGFLVSDSTDGTLEALQARLPELDEEAPHRILEYADLPEAESGARDDSREGERIPLCGGIVVLASSAYESVGGMDESFEGWGGEDDALSAALGRAGLKCGILEVGAAFHLAHPRSMESRYGHAHYARNLERARWWHEASDNEIAEQVRTSRDLLR